MKIFNYDKCTGCQACKFICPKNAIEIKEKFFGFLYPEINSECIDCKICEKRCPTNNIQEKTIKKCYIAKNENNEIRKKSSSGGMFSLIADFVLQRNGIIFGAEFDEKFNVIIKSSDNDISKMLNSKYVASDVKNTFEECKKYLENGRLVLYSGTPCQIYGLKSYLNKEYENLITMDIFCHGTPSPMVWQNYLKEFNKKIKAINFRDKENGWENYIFKIEFEDGTVFKENHKDNKFMKLFLSNKILKKSCYECNMRSKNISDITVGDCWNINNVNRNFNDHLGVSAVIIHSQKGQNIFNQLELKKEEISYNDIIKNNCVENKLKIPNDRILYLKNMHQNKRKIAICTDQVRKNIGGILQAVSLNDKIKELFPNYDVEFINQKNNNHLKYFDKNVKWVKNDFDSSKYTDLLVGSDQIWNKNFCRGVPFDDKYLIKNAKNKIVYAASYGHHNFFYTSDEILKIKNSLKNVKYISTRELSGILFTKKLFGIDCDSVLDPTMLWDKEYYLNKIDEEENKNNSGIFAYILDNNNNWKNVLTKISNITNEKVLNFADKSVENFLKNFNQAKFIVTDSYHGSVFSIIFNKPFLCLRNLKRGNDRFDDLILRFNIENRFVNNFENIDFSLLANKPNLHKTILDFREKSLNFLKESLK